MHDCEKIFAAGESSIYSIGEWREGGFPDFLECPLFILGSDRLSRHLFLGKGKEEGEKGDTQFSPPGSPFYSGEKNLKGERDLSLYFIGGGGGKEKGGEEVIDGPCQAYQKRAGEIISVG